MPVRERTDTAPASRPAIGAALDAAGGTTRHGPYRLGSWLEILLGRRNEVCQRKGQNPHLTQLESLGQDNLEAMLFLHGVDFPGPLHSLQYHPHLLLDVLNPHLDFG